MLFERNLTIIIGLGNPGNEYANTRHNIGFMVVERLAQKLGVEIRESGFKGLFAVAEMSGNEVVLVKPLTFMNRSGECAREFLRHFNLTSSSFLVIHDDLDLENGALKIKFGGGSAGHKGIESLISSLNSDEFGRVRLGIGSPSGKEDPSDFVLEPFKKKEWADMEVSIERAAEAVESIVRRGYEKTMSEYNRDS